VVLVSVVDDINVLVVPKILIEIEHVIAWKTKNVS